MNATLPLPRTIVFSDGATKGNPGPGGWGATVVSPEGQVTELGGAEAHTTNNRMELTGAIRALECARGATGPVDVYTVPHTSSRASPSGFGGGVGAGGKRPKGPTC